MAYLGGWRFCPRCESEIDNDGARAACSACGSVYYAQSVPAVSALAVDGEGRILLARRAYEPDAGLWDLPGGFLEEGEHPLEGLRRELLEEAGVEIDTGEFLGAFLDTYGEGPLVTSVLNLVWEGQVVAGEPTPADDVSELRWFSLDELPPPEELAFRWVSKFLHARVSARAA